MKRLVYRRVAQECSSRRWLTVVSAVLSVFALASLAQAAERTDGAIVSDVIAKKAGSSLEVRIKGNEALAYTSYELPDPARVVIDVANASLKPGLVANLPSNSRIKLQTKEIVEANPQILRFEFTSDKALPYTTQQDGRDVLVNFDLKKVNTSSSAKASSRSSKALSKQLPEASGSVAPASAGRMGDDFGFSGYERERISVDFYKMDLHNVFRFLREISGTNIIVDEAVNGTLTLTLDNVPWDFALDVIMNLKDLKKEERFNTIVIYPKNKDFVWPGKSANKLSFQAEGPQESLVVTRMGQQHSAGLVEASQWIARGRDFEKAHNPAQAVQAYERAFEKWKSNAKLADRISTLYLVELRQYNKALQYARRALAINKNDRVAALNAAIAAANMRDMATAASYFDMSVQGKMPSQEALFSYALFREEARQYNLALQILSRHDALYGRSLDAMVATARILDKMGASAQAVQAYRALLSSGFALPSDLSRFVRARVGMAN